MRQILRERGGASLIEFALVAPVLITTVIAVVEFASIVMVQVLLESGVREAARFGLTGSSPSARAQQIVQIIDERTFGLLEISAGDVETLIYPSFGSIGVPESFDDEAPFNGIFDEGEQFVDVNGNGVWDEDSGLPGAGQGSDIVLYRVKADWTVMTPFVASFIGDEGTIHLTASVAVRNEPF